MQKRLAPFVASADTRFAVLGDAAHLGDDPDEWPSTYGFKFGSMQHNFFRHAPAPRTSRVVTVLTTDRTPSTNLGDEGIVARLFGVLRKDRNRVELEIWHVSVNKTHPLNDAQGGRAWGVYGIRKKATAHGALTRWETPEGDSLTKTTYAQHVRGSPNPYAVECLARTMSHFGCTDARQHEQMPCANLFSSQYDHRSHPSTLLIYRALNFHRAPGLDHYVTHEPVDVAWKRAVRMAQLGLPVVSEPPAKHVSACACLRP